MPQAYECQAQVTKKDIKSYTNQPYKIINNNIPAFTETEKQNTTAFETYSDLDSLGRCGVAYANICTAGRYFYNPSFWLAIRHEMGTLPSDWLSACRRKCK